ncbi:uncharacterized protein DDB_G0287625 isoform X2 [Arachis ipaensis]|uniref:uncharacterized protein DDB_G0287625 isoform X2 n=1 Tax=Arachis ipaensis TaxID=130454 RepID=UPI000A2B2A4A|nr:uncharacterized protein DDB_G0287625 isoform X2 [Arachis ipaensis]
MGKKSSASHKKKRSKDSSKSKTKPRSKSKSRKYKSKKVRRGDVSSSSSDYDDSKSLHTSVSSSSEDNYRRKRDRSRSRKDVKSRKRARRRSYSSDSSEDSHYARKRKKLKRKSEPEVKEKLYKKKIRKEVSVSSRSSGSRSTCSSFQGGTSAGDDDQYESHRGRSLRKENEKRRLEKERIGSEKSSRYRPRSSSSCSRSSESSYERTKENFFEENYVGESNSRRLRSVITVVKEAEEPREFSRNDNKGEILDDYDYPCRSNGSNEGGAKREVDHHTVPTTDEKLSVEGEIGDKNVDSAGTSEYLKKMSEAFEGNLNGDDLESILRQKALENLKKFRGGIQSSAKISYQKNKIIGQVKQSCNHGGVQGKSNVNNEALGTNFDNKIFVEETSSPIERRGLNAHRRNSDLLNMDKDISGSAKNHLTCAQEKVSDAYKPTETVTESTDYRTKNPESTTPESTHESLQRCLSLKQKPVSRLSWEKSLVAEGSNGGDTSEASHIASHSNIDNVDNNKGLSSAVSKPSNNGQDEIEEHSQLAFKQTSASLAPPNVKLPVAEGGAENAARTTQAAIQNVNNSSKDVDEVSNSTKNKSGDENSSVENNSGKLQDESNHDSQFERKTMSLMKGGEMVQVSYQVYIPKKTPALARRQLKR